ncbi:MAG: adenylate cyclase regulatory domain-containing protein [Dehalococcoidia bacterium]
MDGEITLAELSARTGESEEALREWQALGLIGAAGGESWRANDLYRARLVQLLLRRGISLDAIARAEARTAFLDNEVSRVFPWAADTALSLAEAAELAGLDIDVARRFWQAAGLGDESELDRADLAALRGVGQALSAGFPEAALLELFRVFADCLDRAAEAGQNAFHFYVHEPMRAARAPIEHLRAATPVQEAIRPLIEPTILYFFRKGSAKAARDDMVMHVAEAVGLAQIRETPGQVTRAIVFTDLSSFTPLTDAMGDSEAAGIVGRFSDLVREATMRWEGRVVKQIGDAFMLVFADAQPAICYAVEIETTIANEPQFPAARSGVHWGDILYRDGDYVGLNANIASRVAELAERHQVIVTGAARKQAGSVAGLDFARAGKRRLRGVAEEVELFTARPATGDAKAKVIDPVCGMEIGEKEVAARLAVDGKERPFCSGDCLRLFVANPERYP